MKQILKISIKNLWFLIKSSVENWLSQMFTKQLLDFSHLSESIYSWMITSVFYNNFTYRWGADPSFPPWTLLSSKFGPVSVWLNCVQSDETWRIIEKKIFSLKDIFNAKIPKLNEFRKVRGFGNNAMKNLNSFKIGKVKEIRSAKPNRIVQILTVVSFILLILQFTKDIFSSAIGPFTSYRNLT